jgi:GH24 family phage-related lysozyme (muramidase)
MKINQAGLDLIKSFEGLRCNAYKCPAGVWTIGYGHTLNVVRGQIIDVITAEQLLKQDLQQFERAVDKLITVPLTDNQFSALVSFAFNCGEGALSTSTLRRKLNGGDYLGAALEFLKWTRANGKVLPGLVRRRNAEKQLFLKP